MPVIGPVIRITQVRKSIGYLPPWRCDSLTKGRFYLCGHCFGMLGDGPVTNGAEMWMAGTDRAGEMILEKGAPVVPEQARCYQCGKPAWPAD